MIAVLAVTILHNDRPLVSEIALAFGLDRKPRMNRKFCNDSCRQSAYQARSLVWMIEGEPRTGRELEATGWWVHAVQKGRRWQVVASKPGTRRQRPYQPRARRTA